MVLIIVFIVANLARFVDIDMVNRRIKVNIRPGNGVLTRNNKIAFNEASIVRGRFL